MRTRSLVLILLRVFAIYWIFESISMLATELPMVWVFLSETAPNVPMASWWIVIEPSVMIVLSILLWFLSGWLSGAVVHGENAELRSINLTREDLYNFAFVFLGLYFVLASINEVINAGYQFLTQDAFLPETDQRHGQQILPLAGHGLKMAFGFVALLGASKWARMLAQKDESYANRRKLPE